MDIWEKLKVSPSPHNQPESGIWRELSAKTDPTRYVPRKIDAVEESRLASQRSGLYFVVKNRQNFRYLKLTEQDHFLWDRIDGRLTFGDLVMEYFQKFGAFAFNRISSLLDQLRNNYFLEERPKKIFSGLMRQKEKASGFGKVTTLVRAFIQKEVPIHRLDTGVSFLYKALLWPLFTRVAKWVYLLVTVLGFACFVSILNSGAYSIIQTQGSYAVGIAVLIALQVFIILLHEGAHAFAAKSYGREVPRGGFMIYMGMPAFFVDTTDMWLEPKGRRIAVSWAGPYSELIVGGIFSLILVLFPQSPLNPILFKCAFLFYIGVFLNLNPLLELDGYYILVDLLEIPLLRRRSLKFVKSELWRKLRARETFSREEKIFTVFGILAAAYTAFALTVAAYFWHTRIASTFAELWNQGWGSKLVVIVLVFATLVPVAVVLLLKLIQLLRWGCRWLAASPLLRTLAAAGPFLAASTLAAYGACLWQPWVEVKFVLAAVAAFLFVLLAQFLYMGRALLFPKNPWHPLPQLVCAASFFWILQQALAWIAPLKAADPVGYMARILAVILLGVSSLRAFRHLQSAWAWPVLGLCGAFIAAAGASLWPQHAELLSLAATLLLLSTLFMFAVGLREIMGIKMTVPPASQGSDEERLEVAFFSILDCFRRFFENLFSPWVASTLSRKIEVFIGANVPEIQKEKGRYFFQAGLSILEKAAAGKKVFEHLWSLTQRAVGPFWVRLILERTFDALDWQAREILDQYLFKKEDWQKDLVRKTTGARRSLEAILKGNVLFAELRLHEISTLARLFRTESFASGREIIRQGEVGDKFYLIKKGRVVVRVRGENGVEEEVARLGEGDFFGEIALLKEVPRTATCVGDGEVEVWSLDKASFTQYVKSRFDVSTSVERAIGTIRLLTQMPLFRELTPSQMRQLALRFTPRKIAAGASIIRQGEPGEEFFVIEKGECAVKMRNGSGQEKEVAKLKKGEYFGEMALLSHAPRSATVEATQPTDILVLSKKDFDLLIHSTMQASGTLEKVSSRRRLELKKKTL